MIRKSKKLQEQLLGVEESGDDCIVSTKYKLVSGDLTRVEPLFQSLNSLQVDYQLPTLVFSECVLAYIHPSSVNALMTQILKEFQNVIILDYEMFNPND